MTGQATTTNQQYFEINDFEVFACGDYGADGTYGEAELDHIASTVSESNKAPVTIDHAKAGPAYGLVKKLYRKGTKLLANITSVPKGMYDSILQGHFSKRSVEIWRNPDGSPRAFKALTFLGAKPPKVECLSDIGFSNEFDGLAIASIDSLMAKFESFEMPVAPEGATQGVIVKTESSASNLGHYHDCYLDSDSNGFTGGPSAYVNCEYIKDADGHKHLISAGTIQAAGDPLHTHDLTIANFKTNQGSDAPGGQADMSKSNDTPVTITADQMAQFSAQQEKIAKLETENAGIKESMKASAAREVAAFCKSARERFDSALALAISEGRVTPAQKEAETAIFSAVLKGVEEKQIASFSADNGAILDSIIGALKIRPIIVPVSGNRRPETSAQFSKEVQTGDPNRAGLAAEAKKIMVERKVDFETAAKFAVMESNGKFSQF